MTRTFEPGRYRFVVLPEATDARVVTLIEPVARRRRARATDPIRCPSPRRSSTCGSSRKKARSGEPDVLAMTLPAADRRSLAPGREMEATSCGGMRPRGVGLGAGAPAACRSEAGRYRLEVRSIRKNNRAPYTLSAFPEALLPGMEREVRAPGEVPLSVGEAGLVEIESFGGVDVKARLFDAKGAFVTASDDRTDDWNFEIAASLTPGRYLLRVDPVGAASGSTSVRLRVPPEREKPALALPASLEVNPGRGSLVFPLAKASGATCSWPRSAPRTAWASLSRPSMADTWVVGGLGHRPRGEARGARWPRATPCACGSGRRTGATPWRGSPWSASRRLA